MPKPTGLRIGQQWCQPGSKTPLTITEIDWEAGLVTLIEPNGFAEHIGVDSDEILEQWTYAPSAAELEQSGQMVME